MDDEEGLFDLDLNGIFDNIDKVGFTTREERGDTLIGVEPAPLALKPKEDLSWINDFSFEDTTGALNSKLRNNQKFLREKAEKLAADYPNGVGLPMNAMMFLKKWNDYSKGKRDFGITNVWGGKVRGSVNIPEEEVGIKYIKKY